MKCQASAKPAISWISLLAKTVKIAREKFLAVNFLVKKKGGIAHKHYLLNFRRAKQAIKP